MKDYEYLDRDSVYTDKAGVLKNKAGISDADKLVQFESIMVAKRLKELEANPIKIKYAADLRNIHRYLFQDVYDWAGDVRRVEIGKDGRQFLETRAFAKAFSYIDSILKEYFGLNGKKEISSGLAKILDDVNYGHFFREGNGRTQREFIRALALQKGYALNLNPSDDADVYERYMAGTVRGDKKMLADLILELLK